MTGWGSTEIRFRPLRHGDLSLLHRWLNAPHVLEWWDRPGPSYEQVVEKYSPRMLRTDGVHPYVILLESAPVGYLQVYDVEEGSPSASYLPAGVRAVGVDLFIGEAEYIHRGLGSRILRSFVDRVVFGQTNADVCVIDPSERNRIAIRAYEKAGFSHVATFQHPEEEDVTYLMQMRRPALGSGGDEPGAEAL